MIKILKSVNHLISQLCTAVTDLQYNTQSSLPLGWASFLLGVMIVILPVITLPVTVMTYEVLGVNPVISHKESDILLIVVIWSNGDIVTSYDIAPHSGLSLEEVHDTPLIVVSHISLTVKSLIWESGPTWTYVAYSYT